jgi:hypothetical protein
MLVDLSVREPGEVGLSASQSTNQFPHLSAIISFVMAIIPFVAYCFWSKGHSLLFFHRQNWSDESYNNKPFELPLSWVEPEMVKCRFSLMLKSLCLF